MSNRNNTETERKFRVVSDQILIGHTGTRIAQAYLAADDDVELRVRVAGDLATVAVKSGEALVTRSEYEWALPDRELATALLKTSALRIVKDRYDIVVGAHVWNVDVFLDKNEGLVMAEVEFRPGDTVLLPEWVGAEVTGDPRFYNRNLAIAPFNTWPS